MKLFATLIIPLIVSATITATSAFVSPAAALASGHQATLFQAVVEDNCGCGTALGSDESIVLSGNPSSKALSEVNPRQAIRSHPIKNVMGEDVYMDDLLGDGDISVVVFLRSLGWPLCQEYTLQWSQQRNKLVEQLGVNLIMISIGKPEIGKDFVEHLELENGEEYVFVDPENKLYDSLDLNRGVKETFFSVSTPFAFLDRFTKPNGTKELVEVLSKWNKAFYIPPKQNQAFLQGGTFVFNGEQTIFAHYDESTAAHAKIDTVMNLVEQQVELNRQNQKQQNILA